MIKPQPFKFVCPECGFSKVVASKSDALSFVDISSICPKCQSKMQRKELGVFDALLDMISIKRNL
ncbi:MAG: hypothetical protein NTW78_05335 [Campylobacterales bacterium]|nr:hypothetical protein [Campylobacterales bacterium]